MFKFPGPLGVNPPNPPAKAAPAPIIAPSVEAIFIIAISSSEALSFQS